MTRPVTGRWEPYGCPCPRCMKCGCGIENCVNRLAPDPSTRICECDWVPASDLPAGQCFQTKLGIISVVWREHASQLDVRRVIVTDGFDSEYGSVCYLPPDELVKPLEFSVPVESDFLAQNARDRLEAKR